MNKKIYFMIVLIILLSIFGVKSLDVSDSYELKKGKNSVTFSAITPFYVKDLVKLNPEIEAVSYSPQEGESVGFVNVYEGVGRNFVVMDGVYEIVVNEDAFLSLPYAQE